MVRRMVRAVDDRSLWGSGTRAWCAARRPEVWLGWFFYEGEGVPSVNWFVSAAEQYLERAFARFIRRGRRPPATVSSHCSRCLSSAPTGAKPIAGSVVLRCSSCSHASPRTTPVDVCLVTKSARMLSAAQAWRCACCSFGLTAASHGRALGPRLLGRAVGGARDVGAARPVPRLRPLAHQ